MREVINKEDTIKGIQARPQPGAKVAGMAQLQSLWVQFDPVSFETEGQVYIIQSASENIFSLPIKCTSCRGSDWGDCGSQKITSHAGSIVGSAHMCYWIRGGSSISILTSSLSHECRSTQYLFEHILTYEVSEKPNFTGQNVKSTWLQSQVGGLKILESWLLNVQHAYFKRFYPILVIKISRSS